MSYTEDLGGIEACLEAVAAKTIDNERRISKLECGVNALLQTSSAETRLILKELMEKHHPEEWAEQVAIAAKKLGLSDSELERLALK